MQSQGLSESSTPQLKSINSSAFSFLYSSILTSTHDHWKNHNLTRQTSVGKVMSLLFNMWSKLVIAFLPRRSRLLISWLQSPSAGEGNGNPLQYSCLENSMGRGAWWATVHGVAKSRTRLSDFTLTFHFYALVKEMATHSSILA